MTEWGVIEVLIAIIGLFATVGAPLMKNTKQMTELNVNLRNLTEEHAEYEKHNSEAHRRLWQHNGEQDEKIQEHETEIRILKERQK